MIDKRHHKQTFTNWDFLVVTHRGSIVMSENKSKQWSGTIVMETEYPVNNEIEAERDIESLLMMGFIPSFGTGICFLREISFHWETRPRPVILDGEQTTELFTVCVVTVVYLRDVNPLTNTETNERLVQMYGENWMTALDS